MSHLKRVNQKVVSLLPSLIKNTFKIAPKPISSTLISAAFNHLFKLEIIDGELDFLEQRWLKIEVTDLAITLFISLQNQRMVVTTDHHQEDVLLRAQHRAFLQLLHHEVDPDTLFFRRQLLMTGDTEMGLQIKNLLDAMALDTRLPKPLMQFFDYVERHQMGSTQGNQLTPTIER
ncbi:MAG: SCP2 sterol-binding domain-containing protein [Bacterioplanes sp.]|nr:SCP2 sterol-binding domain-containing protein [Bacterioplanes sp.]